MANEYGLELVIPDGFLEKLRQADEELEFTAMQAEETKTRVIKAFKDMGDLGVDYFLKKLKDMQKVMSEISSKNITLKGLESSAKGAAKAADDVVKVAEAFGQVSRESPRVDGGLKNIDEVMVRMMNDIKTTRQELTLYDEFLKRNVISLEEYKRGVDVTSERLESMMRQYEALDKARVSLSGQDGNDLAVQRKNNELSRLNEAYRTGTSELQKQAKAEDEQAKKLQQQQKEQERLAKQQQREDERRQKALEKQQKEQERLNKLKEEEQRKTYQGAMAYSSNAKNMMEDVKAIKYLEAARSKLNRTDSDYAQKLANLNNAIRQHKKNIADAKGETLNLEKQQRSLINTGDQLRRKLGLIFSVSAITGYIKKMVEVRGEFELQKVALAAILQNKEKADELWARTQELALQSPFRLSQLVTFTKQLAAYQVEADKLYDTNKRLADVSAGLGVDMGRLILAFGQVKAANYLRSAEIRQFTEAGINMLGELSKLFTELEGKMVSVGEVQERVQKRMVSFGDVEEVFKRLTDAGGMFYNMQQKQSETLKGMIAKLGDALDIMLNKIGEANEGVLKGAVTIILQVLQSWNKIGDVVVPILSMIITRMATIKVYTKFLQTPQLFGVLINGLREVLVRVGAVKMSFGELRERIQRDGSAMKISAQGWITIITAVIAVIWELHNALSSLNKQQKELDRISLSVQHEANASVRRYKELVEIIKDSTKSYQSQKDALDELRRTYGEILPSEYLEIENIRNIKEGYDAAKEAILSYYQVSARQKEIDFILNEGDGKKMQERQTALIKRIMTAVKAQRPEYEVIQRDIRQFVDSIAEEYKRGEITIQDAEVKLKESLEEFYNIKFPRNPFVQYGGDVGRTKNFWDLFAGSLANLKSSLDDVMSSEFWGMPNRMSITLQDAEKTFEENSKIIQTSFNMMLDWDKLSDAQKESALANLKGFYDSLGEQMPDWSNIVKDPLRFDEETRRFNQLWLKSMEESVRGTYSQIYTDISDESGAAYAVWENFKEGLEQKINSQNLEDWQNLIIGGIYKFAEANKISLDGMNGIVLKSGQTMKDYFASIEGDIDRLKQDIGQAKLDREMFPYVMQPTSDESLQNMEQQLALYEYIMSLYYNAKQADKDSDNADREALNLLKERVRLIQEANKEYEKNLQYFTQEEAAAKTLNSYKNAFKQAGISELLDEKFLTDEGVLNALAQLPINVGGKLRDEALQYIADTTAKVSVELDIDTSQRTLKDLKTQVEELFDGIDIFQDLVKIGFTEEEVRRIFGIEITNTEQLRRRLEEMKDEFVGTKGIEDYQKFMRKIDEIEDKQNVERLKRYEKYLKTMMSESAEIRIQALQDIQDVMKMEGRTSDEKASIVEGINKEAQKKLQEQQWKQLQESDDYQLLFSDIEHLSTTTASRLKNILDELRTSLNELTPHQLRQIQAQYEKLDEQIIKHNPFEAVRESMQAIKGLASESELNETMLGLTGRKEETQQVIDDIDVMLSMIEKGIKYDTLDAKKQEELAEYRKLSKEELLAMRKEQEAMLDDIMAEMGLTEGQINLYKRLRKAMSEADNTWKSVMSSTKQALSDIKGAYEAMNDGAQSITLEIVDAGIALADATHNAVTLYKQMVTLEKEGPAIGAALNSALGIIGLIATAVQTVINVINTISSAYDEDLENDIKDYEHSVNKLADAYDRLSDKIQKAYSFAMLATSTNQGLTNLQEQVVAYESMIEAERDKKDSDSERIEEWTDKVEELRAKMEETKNAAVREAGGLGGEYKDAAQGFVDAWMQAFRETGNGLDALNEHFEDFLWEIAGKQVLLRAADKFFEPLFTELDARMTADTDLYDEKIHELESEKKKWEVILKDYSEIEEGASKADKKHYDKQIEKAKENIDDYNRRIKETEEAREQAIKDALMLDKEDLDDIKQWGETNVPLISDYLKNILGSLGFKGGEEGEALSGLQKGIQGITESTAEIIEAYLNSVRFFVSDSNQKLTELLERFASADDTRSPILAELRAQTSYLNSIDRALSTIIDPSGWRNGGGVLKVMM